jgi:hypothetical protein
VQAPEVDAMKNAMKACAVFATVLAATLAVPPAGAADTRNAQVYLQRTSDGRVILTDRPLDGAKTERTWQLEREDAAAARTRSDNVHREAEAVAERIARRMEMDELRLQRDSDRRRYAVRAEDAMTDDAGYGGYALGYPGGYGLGAAGHRHGDGSRDGRRDDFFGRPFDDFSGAHPQLHSGKQGRGPRINTGARMAPRPPLTSPF